MGRRLVTHIADCAPYSISRSLSCSAMLPATAVTVAHTQPASISASASSCASTVLLAAACTLLACWGEVLLPCGRDGCRDLGLRVEGAEGWLVDQVPEEDARSILNVFVIV